jgi:chemotaxis protein CheX
MKAEYMNPFLSSSIHVIETFIQIKPSIGQIVVKNLELLDDHIWLKIGIIGQFQGNVVFGFPKDVAMKIVSAMMGGYAVTEMDEMCQSAISELGNMISGNASTMLYNEGVHVDITPPNILKSLQGSSKVKAFTVPMSISSVGDFGIHMLLPN